MENKREEQIPLFDSVILKFPEKPSDPPENRAPKLPDSKRPISEGAERHLGLEHQCLDNGLVRLVDYMGGDDRIVQSARVSYGPGTKTVRQDRALIDYLIRNGHTSPFEQVVFTFHLKMPIFVARQWIRHRTARLNEISARYSFMPKEFYLPDPSAIRYQSEQNKQGRSEDEVPPEIANKVLEVIRQDQDSAFAHYTGLIEEDGVARELARIGLPVSLYTEMYWQIDLHNLFHFLRLRTDEHAQYEIREYAETIAEIVKDAVPLAYEVFEEHVLYGIKLSRSEQEAVKSALFADNPLNTLRETLKESGLKGKRRRELYKKLGIDPHLPEDLHHPLREQDDLPPDQPAPTD